MSIRLCDLVIAQEKSKIKAGEGKTKGNYKFFTSSNIQTKYVDFFQYDKPALIFGTGGVPSIHYCDEPFSTSTDCLVLCAKNTMYSLKSLYLFFESHMNLLEKGFHGAGLQHISKKYILDIQIPDIPIDQQSKINDIGDQLNKLINIRKQQFELLDMIVKSRFIEMFGMPGTDNFGRGMVSLGDVCQINPKKGQDQRLSHNIEVSFVPMSAVSEQGEINATTVKKYDEVKTGFTYFIENDVLFAKITPCMENGKGAVARNLHNGMGFGSTEFHVLRPIDGKTNADWIYTLTIFHKFRLDAANHMSGSAGQRRVPASFLENYRVSVPPFELQEKFSGFVKQVDKSKFECRISLNLLKLYDIC